MLFNEDPKAAELEAELCYQSFSESVEYHMIEGKFDSYLSCIVDLCNELDIEFAAVSKLLSPVLKDKLQLEAEEKGMLVRTSKPMAVF